MDRIDTLALFVAAIDTGSLSGAARKCGVSLSSVSRHLTSLEERIGTRLIVRTTRMLILTDAGQRYYDKARRVLSEIDDIEAGLQTDTEILAGRLHVGGPTLFGRVFMLPLLAKFAARHPNLVLDVDLLDRQINLVAEAFDLAVRIGPMVDSGLIVRKLGTLRWVICGSPAYLAARGTPASPSDLAKHDCLHFSARDSNCEWELTENKRVIKLQVPVRMRSNTLDGVVAAAVGDVGLVWAPAWSVMPYVRSGDLSIVLEKHEQPPRPINAVFTHNRLMSAKVRTLLDFLVEHLGTTDFDSEPPSIDR